MIVPVMRIAGHPAELVRLTMPMVMIVPVAVPMIVPMIVMVMVVMATMKRIEWLADFVHRCPERNERVAHGWIALDQYPV